MFWALGSSDKYLSFEYYKRIREWYRQGKLDGVVNTAYYAFHLKHLWDTAMQVLDNVAPRVSNLMGISREGRMPVYPGRALDQAVFIDAKVTGYLTGFASGFDIVPLKTIDIQSEKLTPWQAELAALVNNALKQGVEYIQLSVGKNGVARMRWQRRDGWFGVQ